MSQSASRPLSFPGSDRDQSLTTSPGGQDPIKWEIVARTAGLAPAHIIAGRLQTAGIPARAWQEAAGQAIGLTVGILGTGYVAVPSEFVAEAEILLGKDDDPDRAETSFAEQEEDNNRR